jgi:hypothetical protein
VGSFKSSLYMRCIYSWTDPYRYALIDSYTLRLEVYRQLPSFVDAYIVKSVEIGSAYAFFLLNQFRISSVYNI